MKHILTIAIILGAVALIACTASCKRAKVATIIDDELNQDLCSQFGGELDSFAAGKDVAVDIFSIKHGSLAARAAGKWIYFDPVTAGAQPVTDYTDLPKADYIFVTHNHGDHLDSLAIAQLLKEGTKIICNPGSAEKVASVTVEGINAPVVAALANGESFETAEGWKIDAVPAYNISEEKQNFHPKGVGNGYVLTVNDFRLYVAGDTEEIEELSALKDIDVAFLPCNLPFTMTPGQCASAAKMFSPKVLFPYHYGETDLQPLVDLLSDTDIEVRIRPYK